MKTGLKFNDKKDREFSLSFFLFYKVIFFAYAKSDISLAGSYIARLCLAVIFYSPKADRVYFLLG
jgi:hypothetical protein